MIIPQLTLFMMLCTILDVDTLWLFNTCQFPSARLSPGYYQLVTPLSLSNPPLN